MDTIILRRYIDFPKFLSLIGTETLYFPSAVQLRDMDKSEALIPSFQAWYKVWMEKEKFSKIEELMEKNFKSFEDEFILVPNKTYRGNYVNTKIKFLLKFLERNILSYDLDCKKNVLKALSKYKLYFDCSEGQISNNELVKNLSHEFMTEAEIQFDVLKSFPEKILIACWYSSNDSESDAMWKLYSKEEGIAIETTDNKLNELVEYDSNLMKTGDFVKYRTASELKEIFNYYESYAPDKQDTLLDDLSNRLKEDVEWIGENIVNFALLKRKCFEHENEYRFILSPDMINEDIDIKEMGELKQSFKIKDLNEFIDRIIISPYSPPFVEESLKCILQQSENKAIKALANKIVKSEMI